ncbi:limonene-1,2-epoxide hydrolase [Mycobacterium gordonae]|uniref:Limonene-1,2-epoxide hydrolase n=1 Tax=Mycobacterium gordonae TaxID=1778 RepID=A0A0Q2QFT5_MYCGO|nr:MULTISPECIES: limonene-1,2-epoxide hydrolase family protein [Mycobacterium]KQH78645.1 limonene-1,2-epoxide hydrolase [Mycobacterium gordonae]MDP7729018.1 limonene-1,2-epoxide hydrolase family protein [Mycobacterium sp. TY813]
MTELTQKGPGSGADTTDNIRAVEDFLNALQAEDFDTVDELLHDNLVYENVGFSRIRGGRKTTALLSKMQGRIGFEVKIHRIAADGSAVLTERTDALILGPLRLQFWVCGTFELQDGRITLWRDYFDSFDMLKATLRGVAGVVVPSLRATL